MVKPTGKKEPRKLKAMKQHSEFTFSLQHQHHELKTHQHSEREILILPRQDIHH